MDNTLDFSILEAGDYILLIDNCLTLQWGPITISEAINCPSNIVCPTCPNSTADPNLQCVFIDATLPGMGNIDAWVANGTVPTTLNSSLNISEIIDLHFIVQGNLQIGQNNLFWDCHFSFVDANSGLESTGTQLVFGDCVFEACLNSWEGITVNNIPGTLHFSSCNISNAANGISIQGNVGNFDLFETTIENCPTAIMVRGSFGNQIIIANVFFYNNVLEGGNVGNGGIGLLFCDFGLSTFQAFGGVNEWTQINNYPHALGSVFSSINLGNLDINGTGPDPTAIMLTANLSSTLENISVSDYLFNDIQLIGSDNTTITNFTGRRGAIGINARNCDGFLNLSELDIESRGSCIDMDNCNLDAGSSIDNFLFSCSQDNGRAVINLNEVTELEIGTVDQGLNNDVITGGRPGESSISANMCNNLVISNLDLSQAIGENGIEVNGGNAISIRDNTITSTDLTTGIECDFVSQLFICGNDLANCDNGTIIDNGFSPIDPAAADLTRYWLNNHSDNGTDGLTINFSPIGEQAHAGNTWDQSSGWIEDNPNVVDFSQFPVESVGFHPTSTNINPTSRWFPLRPGTTLTGDCSSLDTYNTFVGGGDPDCPTGVPDHCFSDPWFPECEDILMMLEASLGNQWPNYINNAQKYNLQVLLTQQLQLDYVPVSVAEDILDCLNQVEDLESEYVESESTPIRHAELNTQVETIMDLDTDTRSVIRNLDLSVDQLYDQISLLDSESEVNYGVLSGLMSQISVLRSQQSQILQDHKDNASLDADILYNSLVSAGGGSDIASYYNKALEIRAFLLNSDIESLPQSYRQDLTYLSQLCPLEYGYPVYYARGLNYRLGGMSPSEYDDKTLCAALGNREKNISISNDWVRVFPNPTKDVINVNIHSDLSEFAKVSLLTLEGVELTSYTSIESESSMDVSGFSDGVYYVKVSNGQIEEIFKIIIIR